MDVFGCNFLQLVTMPIQPGHVLAPFARLTAIVSSCRPPPSRFLFALVNESSCSFILSSHAFPMSIGGISGASAIHGCGFNSCGCNSKLAEVRSGLFGGDLGFVGPQAGSTSTPKDPDLSLDNLELQPIEFWPLPWIAEVRAPI